MIKGKSQFLFCVTPQNNRLMFVSWKYLKSTVTKKIIMRFYNFAEENF